MLRIEDLGPKAGSKKQKRQQACWRSGVRSQLYPRITIRQATVLVKEKVGTRERDRRERTKAAACDRRPRHAAPTERCRDRDLGCTYNAARRMLCVLFRALRWRRQRTPLS